ncbi:MAG: DUF5089 domain-containing protein [Nitrosopumilus sp.]|nr:DUF5089 domain-containing protein [Nitrosopumilus sp.]
MTKTIWTMTIATILVAGLVAPAFTNNAYAATGFAGDYDPVNWTLTNTNTDGFVLTSGAPASIELVGGDQGFGGSGDTDYTVPVACEGDISFDWTYKTLDFSPFWDPAGYLVNGAFIQLSDNAGLTSQTGSTTVTVSDGDVFGFRVHTVDNIFGEGSFATITNLQTPDCTLDLQGEKLSVISTLESLKTGDEKTDKKIDKVIKHIIKSTDDKFWEDEETLVDDKKSKKVFDEEKKAVKGLKKLIKKADIPLQNSILDVVNILLDVDRALAENAITEASIFAGDKKVDKELEKSHRELGKVQKELDKAQEEIDNGKPDKALDKYGKAIDKFKKAWEHARHAIKHATT